MPLLELLLSFLSREVEQVINKLSIEHNLAHLAQSENFYYTYFRSHSLYTIYINMFLLFFTFITFIGVRPYKCNHCDKSFTQRCSLESHTLKVHGIAHDYAYKERRNKIYVCEECGNTTPNPEEHYMHLKIEHPYSPALAKFYDKRHFKFSDSNFPFKETNALASPGP